MMNAQSPFPGEVTEAVRSTRRWAATVVEHSSLRGFLECDGLKDGLHTIFGEGPPIDILLRMRPGLPAIFSFHGNAPRNAELKLPVFTGVNVTGGLPATSVLFSDPSLYLDPSLQLAWFAGSAQQRLQDIYPAIITKIAAAARSSNLIFFGGSGGGFAALYYSSFFPESFSLVFNPQTDLSKYLPSLVEEYGRIAFGLRDHEETMARLSSLISCSLAARYEGDPRNLVLYLQNNSDSHVQTHLGPFLARFARNLRDIETGAFVNRQVADGKWLYLDHWGDGHHPPPPDLLRALLETIVSSDGRWRQLMATGELGTLIAQAAANVGPLTKGRQVW